MSGTVNRVILVANLGRDPEIRSTQDGSRIGNLSVATSESWKDRSTGERKERTEWHRVVIFDDKLVEVAEKYLKKGSKVYLEGQLQTRKWTDQAGVEKYSTEVVLQRFRSTLTMLDSREGVEQQSTTEPRHPAAEAGQAASGTARNMTYDQHLAVQKMIDDKAPRGGGDHDDGGLDDEIPF